MRLKIIRILDKFLSFKDLEKVILVFGIFLICVIWILFFHKIETEREIEINSAIKGTANLARAFEEHTLRTIKNADQAIMFLKYQYEKEGRDINIHQYVREGRFSNQPFILMGIIDENGDLVVSDQLPFKPSNLKDREHFFIHKDLTDDTLFISKPVLGRSSGKWSIQMTRRISKPDGSFGGVVVISVDPFYFTEFYKQMDLGKNSSITLVGADGIIRARQSEQNAEMGQDINGTSIMEHLFSNKSGYHITESQIDNVKRIYSYRVLSNYPLAVVVGIDEAEALKGLKERVVGYCIITLTGIIIVICFIILSLRMIKHQARDKKLLKRAYNTMEAKVLLRTQELFLANEELASANEYLWDANKKLAQKNEQIRKIAYSDALTGLPNRLYFNAQLDVEMDRASRGEATGSVMFIDLDDFKTINDVFGHSFGDELIVKAGQRIVAKAGNSAFVARIGGDEFVVILHGVNDRIQIADIADKIVKELRAEYEVCGEHFLVSASIGIAIYPTDGCTTDEILKYADNAMYAAKRKDKNCWCFFEKKMQDEVLESMVLKNSLYYAVERGELLLKYQPIVTTEKNNIVGFEALLRWNSMENGFVSPARFIPIAEQSGQIHYIGVWVLKEACGFIRRLADKGYENVYIAVNISVKQLVADNFVSTVRSIIAEAKIMPSQIVLEITESFLMISIEDAVRKLAELRAIGIRLSLDDFGTGYSSLTYLWNLPVDILKIDKSFIDIIRQDLAKADIISSIIKMAHDLKLVVVAEGIENRQQYIFLSEKRCDFIQGYYISKPVSEIKAMELLSDMESCLLGENDSYQSRVLAQ